MDGGDAGDGARLAVGVAGLQVSVSEGQEPPDHSEQHPGAEEGRGEDEEGVLPLQVHHGSENILQEPTLKHEEEKLKRKKEGQTDCRGLGLIYEQKCLKCTFLHFISTKASLLFRHVRLIQTFGEYDFDKKLLQPRSEAHLNTEATDLYC